MALGLHCRLLMVLALLGVMGVTVAAPPTVSITAPGTGSGYNAPAQIVITANAADSDGTVTQVEFFQGSTSLGVDTVAPYSVQWSSVSVGNYSLTARATDNGSESTTSTAVAVTVNPAPLVAPVFFSYDGLGRLTGMGSSTPAASTYQYQYDATGNITSISEIASGQVAIVAFNPGSGGAGAVITIHGTGFSATAGNNVVTFNGTTATVTTASTTQLTVTVPSGATTGLISVTSPNGSANSATNFTITATPAITSFNPTTGVAGTAVTISGTNFSSSITGNTVRFNTRLATVTSASATSLTAKVPSNVASGKVQVSTAQGAGISANDFIVPPGSYSTTDVESVSRMVPGESKVVTVTTANKISLMLFDGNAGQRISVVAPGQTPSRTVSIIAPDGTVLGSSSYLNGQTFDALPLPSTGTYTIVMDPSGTATGSVTLTLYNVPPDTLGTITIGGPTVTATITTAWQNAQLAFSGAAQQRVSALLSNSTINNCSSGNLFLQKPDGANLGSIGSVCHNAFLETQTLPVNGTYTLLVDPSSTNTGNVAATLYNVPPDVTGSMVINGAVVPVTIAAPGQNARITFQGTLGQLVTVRGNASTIGSLAVKLLRPDGTTQATNSTSQANFTLGPQTIGVTGTYTVLVDPNTYRTGSVNMSVTSP